MLLEELDTTVTVLQHWVADLGEAVLDGPDAARVVERFAKLERLAAAGRTLAARRVAQTNGWKPGGSRSAADWVADKTSRLTPDQGALLLSALDVEHQWIFEQARAQGRHEPTDAYRADALVNLARNTLYGMASTDRKDPTTATANAGSPCASDTSPSGAR